MYLKYFISSYTTSILIKYLINKINPVEHRPQTILVSIQLCLVQLNLKSFYPFFLQISFPGVPWSSSVSVHAVPTVMLVWQCCHRFFSVCVQASSVFFSLAGSVRALDQFVTMTLYWLFSSPASICLQS